jgi:DNA invertase Pin-like site-specific DNA recombinase
MDRLFALISLRVEIFNQQKLYLQMSGLKDTGVREDRIFTDMMTGSSNSRDSLQNQLARAEKDGTIITNKMDRMGRNTADMLNIADRCYKKWITIKFLENGLSTEGTMGKMIIQILAAVAEAERERILERTNDGSGNGFWYQIWPKCLLNIIS